MRPHPRSPRRPSVSWQRIVVAVGVLVAFFGLLVAIEHPAAAGGVLLTAAAGSVVARWTGRDSVPVPGTALRLRVSTARSAAYWGLVVALVRTDDGRGETV